MKKIFSLITLFLIVISLFGCESSSNSINGSKDVEIQSIDILIGNTYKWERDENILVYTFHDNGILETKSRTHIGLPTMTYNGTYTINGNEILLKWEKGFNTLKFRFSFDGDNLVLTDSGGDRVYIKQ